MPAPKEKILKEVAADPGVGFSVRNGLLFAGNNPLGLTACVVSAVIAVAAKTAALTRPDFLQKFPRLSSVTCDDRTPLWALAISCLVVAIGALAKGEYLAAVTGLLFAVANARIAESISRKIKGREESIPQTALTFVKIVFLAATRPDLYICAGTFSSGLMAGEAAAWTLPFIAWSFIVILRNALLQRPEYAGYPKSIISGTGLVFAIVGFYNGNLLIAISHLMGTAILINIESRITPGGFAQIWGDIRRRVPGLSGKPRA